jgi:hypothetical protein
MSHEHNSLQSNVEHKSSTNKWEDEIVEIKEDTLLKSKSGNRGKSRKHSHQSHLQLMEDYHYRTSNSNDYGITNSNDDRKGVEEARSRKSRKAGYVGSACQEVNHMEIRNMNRDLTQLENDVHIKAESFGNPQIIKKDPLEGSSSDFDAKYVNNKPSILQNFRNSFQSVQNMTFPFHIGDMNMDFQQEGLSTKKLDSNLIPRRNNSLKCLEHDKMAKSSRGTASTSHLGKGELFPFGSISSQNITSETDIKIRNELNTLENNVRGKLDVPSNTSNNRQTMLESQVTSRSSIQEDEMPSPPSFFQVTPLPSFRHRVSKNPPIVDPDDLAPGAYRVGTWETLFNENDIGNDMAFSERCMRLSESEREREEERSIEQYRQQLMGLHESTPSNNDEPDEDELSGIQSYPIEDQNQTAFRRVNTKSGWKRSLSLFFVVFVGSVLFLAFYLKKRHSGSQTYSTSECISDFDFSQQCQALVSNIPKCVTDRYAIIVSELQIPWNETKTSCSSDNLAILSMAAANQTVSISNFVLSSLFFSTEGPKSWRGKSGWVSTSSVCTWEGITCKLICKSDENVSHECEKDPSQIIGINLNSKGLEGKLPTALRLLTTIETLTFSFNDLGGNLPSELCELTNLSHLDISQNALESTIPTTISSWTNLQELRAESSGLSGTIPSEIGMLRSLILLDLSSNQLTGKLPTDVGNLKLIEHLKVELNQLSGQIPEQISYCSNLELFTGFNNQFTGTISSKIQQLQQLSKYIQFCC